ncbi:unnamed protein product [Prorocentrum cordatum]|uniref:Uncharacterized protein n=1 Tax=Prorocentrum cordatum TaxID=2364126 RepID=A0ABN9WKC4_9DINO|nr:unnamed protein product [Polarella glacialis]
MAEKEANAARTGHPSERAGTEREGRDDRSTPRGTGMEGRAHPEQLLEAVAGRGGGQRAIYFRGATTSISAVAGSMAKTGSPPGGLAPAQELTPTMTHHVWLPLAAAVKRGQTLTEKHHCTRWRLHIHVLGSIYAMRVRPRIGRLGRLHIHVLGSIYAMRVRPVQDPSLWPTPSARIGGGLGAVRPLPDAALQARAPLVPGHRSKLASRREATTANRHAALAARLYPDANPREARWGRAAVRPQFDLRRPADGGHMQRLRIGLWWACGKAMEGCGGTGPLRPDRRQPAHLRSLAEENAGAPLNGGAAWSRLVEEACQAVLLTRPREPWAALHAADLGGAAEQEDEVASDYDWDLESDQASLRRLLTEAARATEIATGAPAPSWEQVVAQLIRSCAREPLATRVAYARARLQWFLCGQTLAALDCACHGGGPYCAHRGAHAAVAQVVSQHSERAGQWFHQNATLMVDAALERVARNALSGVQHALPPGTASAEAMGRVAAEFLARGGNGFAAGGGFALGSLPAPGAPFDLSQLSAHAPGIVRLVGRSFVSVRKEVAVAARPLARAALQQFASADFAAGLAP